MSRHKIKTNKQFREYYSIKSYTGASDKILSEYIKHKRQITVLRFHEGAEYLAKCCWDLQQLKIDKLNKRIKELEKC